MAVAELSERIDEGPAMCFVLDTHHVAMLDRFLARARRYARLADLPFPGVTLEIAPTGLVSISAIGLEPLVLASPAAAIGDAAGPAPILGVSFSPASSGRTPGTEAGIRRAHPRG